MQRNTVERRIDRLGRWRDLATRCELAIAHRAALHQAAIVIWARR
ncbi:hypothetical protein ACFC0C_03390 [Streptomyces sp. NPDC056178]